VRRKRAGTHDDETARLNPGDVFGYQSKYAREKRTGKLSRGL